MPLARNSRIAAIFNRYKVTRRQRRTTMTYTPSVATFVALCLLALPATAEMVGMFKCLGRLDDPRAAEYQNLPTCDTVRRGQELQQEREQQRQAERELRKEQEDERWTRQSERDTGPPPEPEIHLFTCEQKIDGIVCH